MQPDPREAIALWPQLQGAAIRLLNHSENHTFLFDGPRGRYTLRVHRPDYQNSATIESELAWLAALGRDTEVPIAHPVAAANGRLLQQLPDNRFAVLFQFIAGEEPTHENDLGWLFEKLGTYAARLHLHSLAWVKPKAFKRQAWSASTILDPAGLWGNWRIAPGVDGSNRPIIEMAVEALRKDLAAYGTSSDRYGLIHADMRLGNLLVDGSKVSLIDFDDCGFCWFTYDFAAAISFHETHPAVPTWKAAWLKGYQQVRQLTATDIASIDSMILLRRMALLAWIGTHAETKLAQAHMPGFADGTAELASRYLAVRTV